MEQLEEKQPFDVIVIGAGAAGMMAAGTAARSGRRVLLIEKMEKSGRKVRITGKGRCNVTNARPAEEFADQVRTNAEFFKVAFSEFNNRAAIKFFERAGVKLDIERGDRVFPQSGKAWDIANALLEFCVENGVKIIYNTRVTEILTLGDRVFGVKYINRRGFERKEECAQVILATGGVSYPATGSTGDGYDFARSLGHSVTELKPALIPFTTAETWPHTLSGLSLRNVEGSLWKRGKKMASYFGEMLFTHFGVSGPIILMLSMAAAHKKACTFPMQLRLDLKPALSKEKLDARLRRDFEKYIRKEAANALKDLLPQRLIPIVLDQAGIARDCPVNQISREQRQDLADTLKALSLTVTGTRPIEEAIVTAGGISVKEINPKTMESKLVPHLYFAGEVIDIDAFTGGYNLQAAFSTGFVAGTAAATKECIPCEN